MFSEVIYDRIRNFDYYAKDRFGNINEEDKVNQFIDNLIDDDSLKPATDEDYISYSYRYFMQGKFKKIEVPHIYQRNYLNKADYVSSLISDKMMDWWHPGGNIFISAGTGKGKNTFIKNHLLKSINNNENVVIFENRESLLTQQKLEMIQAIDPEAFIYQDIEGNYKSENMVVFGKHRNIMLISYQKAALKLSCDDMNFLNFLRNAKFLVFDETHFFIDDSVFNKGVNVVANYLLKWRIAPNAINVFMSGSLDEMLLWFQLRGYAFVDDCFINYYNLNDDYKKFLWVEQYQNSMNHFISLPTDYSYISPYVFENYSDLLPLIESSDDKWLIFIDSKKHGSDLCNEINQRYGENTAVFLNADNKLKKDISVTYQKLIHDECFENKVLISTSVIYNGVNIRDRALRNIVLPTTTIPVIKQMIGRKRLSKDDSSVNVYLPKPSFDELRKRLKRNINDYFEIINYLNFNINGQICAINGLCGELSKYIYAVKDKNQFNHENIAFDVSEFAELKLYFDTMFNLLLLQKMKKDGKSYAEIVLDNLGIGNKAVDIIDVTPLSEAEKRTEAKKEMSELLEEYVGKIVSDTCVNEEYTEIPCFTEKVNNIYKKMHGTAIDKQWSNRKRTVSSNTFNNFIKELELPYSVEISAKDKNTGAKTLTVNKEEDL